MRYFSLLLLFLLSSVLSFSQVNQSKSICSGEIVNLTSSDFGLPDTTTYTWNYSLVAGSVSGYNATSTNTKIFNQTRSEEHTSELQSH